MERTAREPLHSAVSSSSGVRNGRLRLLRAHSRRVCRGPRLLPLGRSTVERRGRLTVKGFLRWAADWRMLRLDGSTGRLEPVWRDLTPANLPTGSTGPASLTRRGTLLYASSMGLAEFDFNGNLVDSRQLWDSPADESWSVMNFGNTADNTTWFGTAKAARVFDGDPMTTGTIRIFGPTQLGCGIAMGDGSLMGGCTTVSAADPSTGRTIWKLRNHGGTAGLHFLECLATNTSLRTNPIPRMAQPDLHCVSGVTPTARRLERPRM